MASVHFDGTRIVAGYHPRTPVPGSKIIRAKQLLSEGKSLSEAAVAVDLPRSVLDMELCLLGFRLEARA